MGLLDKVKAQAEQAMAKAQQGVAQGQGKLDTMQAKKSGDKLLRDLGVAVYAQRRQGGSDATVEGALTAVDQHVAANGPLDTGADVVDPNVSGDGSGYSPAADPAAAEPGPGTASFNLDDL